MDQVATGHHVPSRRERVRAATTEEIKLVARRILVEEGPRAVSLRAIARQMGMTAPALYRYFGSHDELIRSVIGDIYLEITRDVQAAIDAAGDDDAAAAKLVAAAREFRTWSLRHQGEFALLFGAPLPGIDRYHKSGEDMDAADEYGFRFGDTFLALFVELWHTRPFPVRAPEEIDPKLRSQLEHYQQVATAGGALIRVASASMPLGAVLAFLYSWTRLYGMVSLEVYGHLGWILDDAEPMFEMMLAELAPKLGLEYPGPPAPTDHVATPDLIVPARRAPRGRPHHHRRH